LQAYLQARHARKVLARWPNQTLKREDSRTLVFVDDVGGSSLTCYDALGTSTGGDTRRNLLRTRCGLERPGRSDVDVRSGVAGRTHGALGSCRSGGSGDALKSGGAGTP